MSNYNMSNLENAKKLFNKIDEINTLEEDPRISKDERDALALNPLISNANWDLLKAMRGGVHHKQEFDVRGVKVYLRMLCVEETEEILNTLMMKGLVPGNALYELNYFRMTLAKASTPHPDLKIGEEPMLNTATLNRMTLGQLFELGNEHDDFVNACNIDLHMLSENQLKETIALLEKKPILWKDLLYVHKGQIMIYLIEQCKTLKELRGNLTTQS